jgi:hypothetical protein
VSDPVIPSGREFDEGLARGERKEHRSGLLGRIVTKVRGGRKSKVYEFQLRLGPQVAARSPSQPTQVAPSLSDPASQIPAARQAEVGPVPPRTVSQLESAVLQPPGGSVEQSALRTQRAAQKYAEKALPGGGIGLASWLLLANPDELVVRARSYLETFVRGMSDEVTRDLVTWRLGVNDGAKRQNVRAGIPGLSDGIVKVLRFLDEEGMSLPTYRALVGSQTGKDGALAQLRLLCRDYPSAEPILTALLEGRVAEARRAVDFNGPAWHYGMSVINAAVAAVVDGVPSGASVPTCAIPRAWLTGSPEQRCSAAAVSSILPDRDRARLRRRFEPEFVAALDSLDKRRRAEVTKWLTSCAVEPIVPETDAIGPPRQRKLRIVTPQPRTAVTRPRAPRRAQPRCRWCGIGEASIGGICSSCAERGD